MTDDSPKRAFSDFSPRVKLRITGNDRVRFLNGQITNDVRKATPSEAIEACVVNAKGKLEAHVFVHAEAEAFLVDSDPEIGTALQSRLERYIIADDVQLEDVTTQFSVFHVVGAVTQLGSFAKANIVSVDRFGIEGHDLWIESDQHDRLAAELGKHFDFRDDSWVEVFRIERGIPRWGYELTPDIIPLEAGLEERCVDYEKGCYIGQEVISRMKMSGQRNKQLRGLASLDKVALFPGMRLFSTEVGRIELNRPPKDAGWITSAVCSPRLGSQIGLGFVKRGFNAVATKLEAMVESEASPVSVLVVDLPFTAL